MKISFMLARENFYEIIEKTLNNYNNNSDNKVVFLSFPHLNVIVKDFKNKKIRDYIRTEYSIGGSIFKRLLVRSYLEVVFKFPKLFNSRKLELSFDGNDRSDTLIYPCNHRVRVFYFEAGVVDVLVKCGFNPISSQNEIDFRIKYPLDFVPGIIHTVDEYYSEKIIDGTPLPRLLDNQIKEKAIEEVKKNILQFNLEHLSYSSTKDYLNGIEQKIIEKIDAIDDETLSLKIRDFFTRLNHKTIIEDVQYFTPIVISHGDLQHGNVWLEKQSQQIIVFDWESTNNRSIWYDLFFLETSKRAEIVITSDMLISNKLLTDNRYNTSISIIAHTLTVENVEYYISSLSNLPPVISKVEIRNFLNKL